MARRKEQPPSPEEIKQKIIAAQVPFWRNSEPHCALTLVGDAIKPIPLSTTAEQSLIILFLLDLGDYTTDRICEVLTDWRQKYRDLPWSPVLIFEQKYLFLNSPKFLERFKTNAAYNTSPIVLDAQGEWFQHFQTNGEPYVVFLNQGNVVLKEKLWPDLNKRIDFLDEQLQELLRINDPGLPLEEIIPRAPFEKMDRKVIKADGVIQGGVWTQANQSLLSDNSQAALSFEFEGKYLRLISLTHPQAREDCKVLVTLNDQPIPVPSHGAHLHKADKGQSQMEINRATGIYELISSESVMKGKIKMTFTNAVENPVIFYELRVG